MSMKRRLQKYSDEELLDAVRRLSGELGRVPTMVDIDSRGGEYPMSLTITKRFGSWSTAIELALGESVKGGRRPADLDKMERDVIRLATTLGRLPTVVDLHADAEAYSLKPYRRHYGTWSAAVEQILAKHNITIH